VASREFIAASAKDLERFCERRLDHIEMIGLMIDAVTLGGTKFVTALVIDRLGYKHIAGFREGATENATVTTDLLEDLKQRGLHLDGRVLVVLDGAKALRASVEAVFGDRALVQRCHEHKIRNVLSYLAKKHQPLYRRLIRNAYRSIRYADAKIELQRIAQDLDRVNPDAAGSLREGLEETLTVHRLELPPILRQTLRTTNPVESPFSQSRHVMRNVRRWRTSDQKRRWLALAAIKAEKSFRRIKGYASLPVLEAALRRLTGGVVASQQTAA
jgi:transposase-like protein